MKLVEQSKIYIAYVPAIYNGSALADKYVSLKNYNHLTVVIQCGAMVGNRAIHMHKASDVSGTNVDNLRILEMWTDTATTGTFVKTAVVSNTFNVGTTGKTWVIEIDAADLLNDALTPFQAETSVNFDCVCLEMNNVAANDTVGVLYILSEPRFGTCMDALAD